MFICPECSTHLARVRGQGGFVYWTCTSCGGSHVGLAVLRRHSGGEAIWRLWRDYQAQAGTRGRPCPTCEFPMRELPVTIANDEEPLLLDVCGTCQFVWFDPGERARLPAPKPRPSQPELPGEAEAALRAAREGGDQQMWKEAGNFGDVLTSGRDIGTLTGGGELNALQQLMTFIVPVEENHPTVHPPVATYSVLALVVITGIWAFQDLEWAVQAWGFIPAEAGRIAGLTVFTSFFIHGGWMHLLGNGYFLWLTGDNVEDFLGPRRFLGLLAMATLVGALAHGAFDPMPERPCVGASGGISGLMAFYALRFPKAKLHMRFALFWVFRLPFWGWFIFWTGLQVIGAFLQAGGFSSISAAAHLGGAGVGLVMWAVWRRGRLAL